MIDWKTVDTVLLDMDGTLLDLRFDNHFWQEVLPAAYGRRRGVDLESARRHVSAEMRRVEGTLRWYCLDYWSALLDMDLLAMKRELRSGIAYRPGAEQFLRRLRDTGKRAVLVTNAHPDVLALKRDRVRLDRYLDACHTSHRFGASKETGKFWSAFREIELFEPARAILVDDSLPVLASAREWGLERVYGVRRPDSCRPPVSSGRFPLLGDLSRIFPGG